MIEQLKEEKMGSFLTCQLIMRIINIELPCSLITHIEFEDMKLRVFSVPFISDKRRDVLVGMDPRLGTPWRRYQAGLLPL